MDEEIQWLRVPPPLANLLRMISFFDQEDTLLSTYGTAVWALCLPASDMPVPLLVPTNASLLFVGNTVWHMPSKYSTLKDALTKSPEAFQKPCSPAHPRNGYDLQYIPVR